MPSLRLDTFARLARWLGPWAAAAVPRGVHRRRVCVAGSGRTIEAYVYEGREPRGVYLVMPGLHFLGPDDPRLDRFCRVLAASGFLVVAPFIASFCSMVIDPSAFDDARLALELAAERAAARRLALPAVFSISFGSALAFDLGSARDARELTSGLIVFGGFAEFVPTVRFAVTGRMAFDGDTHEVERDPLNAPAVYLNVLPFLDVPGDKVLLAQALRTMVYRTWGHMELKRPGARDPHAHAIAAGLPRPLREPFLMGCGLAPGALEWLETGLDRALESLSFIDPGPRLERVSVPVVLVHGRDDDVIPYFESIKLARRLPAASLTAAHFTGMYGHTGVERPRPGAAVREALTMVRMLRALASAPFGDGKRLIRTQG